MHSFVLWSFHAFVRSFILFFTLHTVHIHSFIHSDEREETVGVAIECSIMYLSARKSSTIQIMMEWERYIVINKTYPNNSTVGHKMSQNAIQRWTSARLNFLGQARLGNTGHETRHRIIENGLRNFARVVAACWRQRRVETLRRSELIPFDYVDSRLRIDNSWLVPKCLRNNV